MTPHLLLRLAPMGLLVAALPLFGQDASGPGAHATERYRIQAAESQFTVYTKRAGLLRMFAHDHVIGVRDFDGVVELTPGAITPASLEFIVRSASLRVIGDVKESDRLKIQQDMETQVLEVETYPEILFRTTEVTATPSGPGAAELRITGDLTLRDVTRSVEFEALLALGEDRLRAYGDLTLRQTDFGIRPTTVAGGTVRVRDEIRLEFDVVAARESTP